MLDADHEKKKSDPQLCPLQGETGGAPPPPRTLDNSGVNQ